MPTLRRLLPDRLDWYTLQSLAGPLALSLGVLLLAQLLERLLRLFDMAAASGAAISVVLEMAATLVPHYLGLAVPTAFFAAIFMAVAPSGDDNELDVMLATGRSITRVAVPFFGVAVLLTAFNFYLFGYLQPLSRYGYHVATHNALQAGWNARVEDNRFVSAVHGFTMSADSVGPDGRQLQGVFVERRGEAGAAEAGPGAAGAGKTNAGEEIITAQRGRLVPEGTRLLLELENGLIVRDKPDGSVSTVRFAQGRIDGDFTPAPPPFRARGESVRELTIPELWKGTPVSEMEDPKVVAHERAGELHGRLARTVLPPLLPLLALPLGMAAKRGRRAPGVVFAALALLGLNQALQLGESLAESGRAFAPVAVWTPYALFGVLGIWLFRSSLKWPGDNPVVRAVSAIESKLEGIGRKRKKDTA